jgi:transcriptional regulator with XRE-family HTH domain
MGKTTTTPESRALAAAFKGKPRGFVSKVARQIGVEPNNISHWIHGRRPVPAVYARPLAKALGLADPCVISSAFAGVAASEPSNVVAHPAELVLRPELVAARTANDIDAMRYILSAMVTAMLVHSPTEAADFSRLLRAHAPAKFQGRGFLGELLAIVESGAQPKVAAPAPAKRRARSG